MSAEPRIDVLAPESAGVSRVTLPADLQAAREARRWSRLDVARLTKFQVRQIAASIQDVLCKGRPRGISLHHFSEECVL